MKKIHTTALILVAFALLLQSCSSVSDIATKDVAIGVIGTGAVASVVGVCNWIDGDGYDNNTQPVDPTIDPYQSAFVSSYENDCLEFLLGD
jgi:hypothetical protein